MFQKYQCEGQQLPPTKAALHQAILQAHYQSMICMNDIVAKPEFPTQSEFGWHLDNDMYSLATTKLPPAPNDFTKVWLQEGLLLIQVFMSAEQSCLYRAIFL